MRVSQSHPGSNVSLAEDERRCTVGLAAAHCLDKGLGANCLSADHLNANELCVETVVRKQSDLTKAAKWFDGTNRGMGAALIAASKLKSGVGVNVKQADHSANTCADVIGAVNDKY